MGLTVSTGRGAPATWGVGESESVWRCWQSLPQNRAFGECWCVILKGRRVYGQVKERVLHGSTAEIRTALTSHCDPSRAPVCLFFSSWTEQNTYYLCDRSAGASSWTELASIADKMLCCATRTFVLSGCQPMPLKRFFVSVCEHLCRKKKKKRETLWDFFFFSSLINLSATNTQNKKYIVLFFPWQLIAAKRKKI